MSQEDCSNYYELIVIPTIDDKHAQFFCYYNDNLSLLIILTILTRMHD